MKKVLLDPLEKSNCEQSLIFIDACARELPDIIKGRDLISTMDIAEFEEFIEDATYRAIFCSCSPGEKSYSSNRLKHGIWTWHLIESLAGRMDDAIVRDLYITDSSLKDYLSHSVPKYIRKNTDIRSTQTPYAVVSSANTFKIRKLPEEEDAAAELPRLKLDYEDAYLQNIDAESISSLAGFSKKKGHFIPDNVNDYADEFVKRLLDDDIREELKDIYDNAKKILKLKRRDIDKDVGDGDGKVETEYFRYFLYVEQNPDDCTEVLITRRLIIRVKLSELPDDFDNIFTVNLDEIVIPISGEIDFDELVDGFENLEDLISGRLKEDDDEGVIEYTSADGQIKLTIQTDDKELIIYPKGNRGCLDLIDRANKGLKQIMGGSKKLLK